MPVGTDQHPVMVGKSSRSFVALAVILVGAVSLGLLTGPASLGDASVRSDLLALRGLRAALAALAGAALAVAGVLAQGLLRNPLASPSVLGGTAGGVLGGQAALVLHGVIATWLPLWLAPELVLPLGCMAGALLALALVLLVAGRGDDVVSVLLAGVVVGTIAASLGALIAAWGQEEWRIGRALVAFGLGSVEGKGWRHLLFAVPLVIAGLVAGLGWSRGLDLLLAGEAEAASLGLDVRSANRWLVVWIAVLTGAAVSVGGGIAFVGLVVPHALRPLVGVGHRRLVPAAALGGAAFTVFADALARALPGGELPLGVVTGLIGGPLFLILLVRARREGLW